MKKTISSCGQPVSIRFAAEGAAECSPPIQSQRELAGVR